MLIRAAHKLDKFKKLYVHVWMDFNATRVAVFLRDKETGRFKDVPWEIGFATDEQLDAPDVAYIQGELAKSFLNDRSMMVDKDTARLRYKNTHPRYVKKGGNANLITGPARPGRTDLPLS
jgi:hypothetical protein